MRDEQLQDAFTVWQEISQSPEEFLAYQSRLKYILDEEAKLDDVKHMAEKKGHERGLEQGLEQGKLLEKEETVKRLFKLSLTVDQIAEATSLEPVEVERIIRELNKLADE